MLELEKRIASDGKVLPGDVLNVGSFFNQQIDSKLVYNMSVEIEKLFAGEKITKVVTVEASGIALAYACALKFGVPLVYAKKCGAANVSGEVYSSTVYSYTHGKENVCIIPKRYLSETDRVLVVDDFLANGCALRGLVDIIKQAGATVVGCATGIEKGYQGGGDALRRKGIKVCSMAIIDSMDEDGIVFRPQ